MYYVAMELLLRPIFYTLYSKLSSINSVGMAQVIIIFVSSLTIQCYAQEETMLGKHEVYVVYMGHHGGVPEDVLTSAHHELLSSVKGSHEEARNSMLYSYKHGFSGFSAKLTAAEAAALSSRSKVISVFPSRQRMLHTTRSWEFLGMEEALSSIEVRQDNNFDHKMRNVSSASTTLREQAQFGKDIIIGVLDSGVWPESESFKDHGMDPVPPSWKGVCQSGDAFNVSNCNRKLIGARMYIKGYEGRYGPLNKTGTGEYKSARDKDGHGTHTSSTAAGREVAHAASLGGFGAGTATGGAALARLAVYKVCWPLPGESPAGDNTCSDADMLAAFDDAIADGVHVLSISIGSGNPQPQYFEDSIAIGALHAFRHGIVVSCSAGNAGPTPGTVSNVAPWVFTIAASSVDRTFYAPLVLGNGQIVEGQTVTPYYLEPKFYPLIGAADALLSQFSIASNSTISASQCLENSLDHKKARGKIVLCMRGTNLRVEKGQEVRRAGGAGMILANLPSNGVEIAVDAHMLPATAVSSDIGEEIMAYLKTAKEPKAKLVPARTLLGVRPSPFIAAFSSQGPNSLTSSILKPDISAPGLNILAAWTGENGPTKLGFDKRRVKYNIISGTSMSCPHVSGVAALLKAIHPSWSAAAIKSALMTTASVTGSDGKVMRAASGEVARPFLMGAGEMNPNMAADPGLVYDLDLQDYTHFLCSVGYNDTLIHAIIGPSPAFTCHGAQHLIKPSDLNLPSISVDLSTLPMVQVLRRVKNVGGGQIVYSASVKHPIGIKVEVEPSKLAFTHIGQSQTFIVKMSKVKVEPSKLAFTHSGQSQALDGTYTFGSLTWSDGLGHNVRSPIVIKL